MTATTREQPFDQAQAALRDSQPPRANLFCQDGIEIVDEIAPGRPFPWGIVITAIIGLGFSLAMLGYAYAAERPERQWVIWDEAADRQFHPHQFTSATACAVDIGGKSKTAPDGSRLSCRRIDQRREQ